MGSNLEKEVEDLGKEVGFDVPKMQSRILLCISDLIMSMPCYIVIFMIGNFIGNNSTFNMFIGYSIGSALSTLMMIMTLNNRKILRK